MTHSNFKETILKFLSTTEYSLSNLKENNIRSFEKSIHLFPLFDWFILNISETNCVTQEEQEEYKRLLERGDVLYEEELNEALYSYFTQDTNLLVPFKESLNDTDQELTLLKEQLHYKNVLHQTLCSSSIAISDEIINFNNEFKKAEDKQKEVIKDIYAATKSFKKKLSEVEESVNDIRDDITELAQNIVSLEISADEGIHSLTSDNINCSVWSLTSSSSWQTIRGKDINTKYLCQLSFDKYLRIHKQFLKNLTRVLETLTKVGKLQSTDMDCLGLLNIQERLEKQVNSLMWNSAELEGIKGQRHQIKELHNKLRMKKNLSIMRFEVDNFEELVSLEDTLNNDDEDLSTLCEKWAECKTLRPVEDRIKERIEFSNCLLEKMDELLNPLVLKFKSDKILHEILCCESERIECSIRQYKSLYDTVQEKFDGVRNRMDMMLVNMKDFEDFYSIPLEERNGLIEHLASIVESDKRGVLQTISFLTKSCQKQHEDLYEHYTQERNVLITCGKSIEQSHNMDMSRCKKNKTDSKFELFMGIQRAIDQINDLLEEAFQTITLQDGVSIEDRNEVLDMLKKLTFEESNE